MLLELHITITARASCSHMHSDVFQADQWQSHVNESRTDTDEASDMLCYTLYLDTEMV